jgi:hypothetical protein
MNEPGAEAPDLGKSTDASVGDDTAQFLIDGGAEETRRRHEELTAQTVTMRTPDELGGTGGNQEGGAG